MAISFSLSSKGGRQSRDSTVAENKAASRDEKKDNKPSVFGAESDTDDSGNESSNINPLTKRNKTSHKGALTTSEYPTSVASEIKRVKIKYKDYSISTEGLDPELYQYDTVEQSPRDDSERDPKSLLYLGFAPSQPQQETVKTTQKDSRYMKGLIQTARQRQIERDIAFDKQQLKADLETGEEVGEVFVTGAYKRKLEERSRFEEEQRRKDEEDLRNSGKSVSNLHAHMLKSGIAARTNRK